MSQISIKTNAVIRDNSKLNRNICKLSNIDEQLSSLRHNIDNRIMARRNINSRMHNACISVSDVENQLTNLELFIKNSVDSYCSSDNYVARRVNDITTIQNRVLGNDNNFFKELFDDFINVEKDIFEAGSLIVSTIENAVEETAQELRQGLEDIKEDVEDWFLDASKWVADNWEVIGYIGDFCGTASGFLAIAAACTIWCPPLSAALEVSAIITGVVAYGIDALGTANGNYEGMQGWKKMGFDLVSLIPGLALAKWMKGLKGLNNAKLIEEILPKGTLPKRWIGTIEEDVELITKQLLENKGLQLGIEEAKDRAMTLASIGFVSRLYNDVFGGVASMIGVSIEGKEEYATP